MQRSPAGYQAVQPARDSRRKAEACRFWERAAAGLLSASQPGPDHQACKLPCSLRRASPLTAHAADGTAPPKCCTARGATTEAWIGGRQPWCWPKCFAGECPCSQAKPTCSSCLWCAHPARTSKLPASDAALQIYATLGAPGEEERAWLASLPNYHVVRFQAAARGTLEHSMPDGSEGARAAVRCLLRYTPAHRRLDDDTARWLDNPS